MVYVQILYFTSEKFKQLETVVPWDFYISLLFCHNVSFITAVSMSLFKASILGLCHHYLREFCEMEIIVLDLCCYSIHIKLFLLLLFSCLTFVNFHPVLEVAALTTGFRTVRPVCTSLRFCTCQFEIS